MFEQKDLYHLWMRVRIVKAWYLVAALALSLVICITMLRQNNLQMVRFRSEVYTADQQNGDVNGALKKLQNYVTGHMNTSLTASNGVYPPIQLKYTYSRLLAAAQATADAQKAHIYTDAQSYCQTQNSTDFSGKNRVPCIEDYVTNHKVSAASVPSAMYEFSFISPTWSPDFAGWMVIITMLIAFLTLVRIVLGLWLRRTAR